MNLNKLFESQLSKIKIDDCGEKLVDIRDYCPKILIDEGLKKGKNKPLVRKTIALMLNKTRKYLPSYMTIIVRDAYRPLSEQRRIYKSYLKRFRRENPKWSWERVKLEVNKYVINPNSNIPSGHATGAAVDVSLAYVKNGRRLKMKTSKLTFKEQVIIQNPKLPKNILKNRMVLYDAMKNAGFVNYPLEWWHYSYGDIFAVAVSGGKTAKYGCIGS